MKLKSKVINVLFKKHPISYKAMLITLVLICLSLVLLALATASYTAGAFASGRVFDVKDWLIVMSVFPVFFTTGVFVAVIYDLVKYPHREE